MLLSLRVLADFIIGGLLVLGYMVIYSIPEPDEFTDELYYTTQCETHTGKLCPDCFPKPVNCDFFTKNISFKNYHRINTELDPLNHYLYRRGALNGRDQVVIKDVNPLRFDICSKLNIKPENCSLSNNETFSQELRKRLLSRSPVTSGVRFCPPGDERGLQRFVERFNQPELTTLLLMNTNIHPLMIRLLSQHNKPVPSFVFQGGFLLVESLNGSALSTFYRQPLKLRLRIVYELINAIFEFDAGVDSFRFYLTGIHPDDFVVEYVSESEVKISFANLRSVIIRNDRTEMQDPDKRYFTHTWIECGGACIGYGLEGVCFHQYTDINLFAVCLLLVESRFWKEKAWFLHNDEKDFQLDNRTFGAIELMLFTCAYCGPCRNRSIILEQIQLQISRILE